MAQERQAPRPIRLTCTRCGNALASPQDLENPLVRCAYCGQDNRLPAQFVELERRRQALALRRLAAERQRVSRRKSSWIGRAVSVAVLVGGLVIAVVAFVTHRAADAVERVATPTSNGLTPTRAWIVERAANPTPNGLAATRAWISTKQQLGCGDILVQPTTRDGKSETLNAKLKPHTTCLVVMGTTLVEGVQVTLQLSGNQPLKQALPLPASTVEYRLCPDQAQELEFTIEAPAPFSFAAIECPRTKEEQDRTKADDETTSGLAAMRTTMTQLMTAGCLVIQEPTVKSGLVSSTVTAKETAPCLTFLASAHFPDTILTADIQPRNSNVVVTKAGKDIRVIVCSPIDREYSLKVSSNNDDYFALAAADCPRYGTEGLNQLRKLQGVPVSATADRPRRGTGSVSSTTRNRLNEARPVKPPTSGAVPMDWSKPRKP